MDTEATKQYHGVLVIKSVKRPVEMDPKPKSNKRHR